MSSHQQALTLREILHDYFEKVACVINCSGGRSIEKA